MRALVQRASEGRVWVDGEIVGELGGPGSVVFVGVTHSDTVETAQKLAERVWHLRIFEDDEGVANNAVESIGGRLLVVSQFTLYGDTTGGRRPSWTQAARPEIAEPLIEVFSDRLRELGAVVATGRFRTDMKVELTNDGPFTVMLES